MQKKENASGAENVPLRSRIARPHVLFSDHAQLRLIYRLRISGSRFHRETGKRLHRPTAQRRHSFALWSIACTGFDVLI